MIEVIINFIKSLFIKDKEEPTMEALHNISIPIDTKIKVSKFSKTFFTDYIIDILVIVWAFFMAVILASYLCY